MLTDREDGRNWRIGGATGRVRNCHRFAAVETLTACLHDATGTCHLTIALNADFCVADVVTQLLPPSQRLHHSIKAMSLCGPALYRRFGVLPKTDTSSYFDYQNDDRKKAQFCLASYRMARSAHADLKSNNGQLMKSATCQHPRWRTGFVRASDT